MGVWTRSWSMNCPQVMTARVLCRADTASRSMSLSLTRRAFGREVLDVGEKMPVGYKGRFTLHEVPWMDCRK